MTFRRFAFLSLWLAISIACGCAVVALAQPDVPAEPAPTPAITAKGRVLSVHDGDTLKVEIRFVADVRLLDCWSPEINRVAEREAGLKARDNLKSLAEGKECIVHIPLTSENIGKATSMGRILGRVWVDGKDLSAEQVRGGFATEAKPK